MVVGAWVLVCASLALFQPTKAQRYAHEAKAILPADAPSNRGLDLQQEAFPHLASRSRVAIVFERASGLTAEDRAYIRKLTHRLSAEAERREGWRVLSPVTHPFLKSRLESQDGQAILVLVNLDSSHLTHRAFVAVRWIKALLAEEERPQALVCEITGTAAIGMDYALQAETALHRTTVVTVTAVLLILALVYRAPLAALVPLVSIGIAVFASFGALDQLTRIGWSFTDVEKMFIVVLVFGTGTDFALFWISRYREILADGRAAKEAAASALAAVGPAILASAGTTIAGMCMLVLANLIPYSNAGRALAVALTISLMAALTLVPALGRLMGEALFWPARSAVVHAANQAGVWGRVGSVVVRRPGTVLFIGMLCFIPPILATVGLQFRYDTLREVPEHSSSARGMALAQRHFSEGKIASFDLLIDWRGFAATPQAGVAISRQLAGQLVHIDGVADVWSWATPFGKTGAKASGLLEDVIGRQAQAHYLSETKPVMRVEVMLRASPWSRDAMRATENVITRTRQWVRQQLGADANLLLAGSTPYIMDVASYAGSDRRRIMPLVVLVIWVIVIVLLRDAVFSAFMLAATLLTYGATLGLAHLFFFYVLDSGGIDYKVNLFLFVLIVAVGQDYNIYLITRLRQETAAASLREGTLRAITRTGSVISNCGLIMAAALGSLAVTGLDLLEQLGFALPLGVLIDTFIVRPLLVPSFYLLWTARKKRLRVASRPDALGG